MPDNILKMKAQTQLLPTIFVLIIFFMLISIGFIFYTQSRKQNIQQELTDVTKQKAELLMQQAANLPELKCSYQENCIDYFKLQNAKLDDFTTYGYSKITVSYLKDGKEETKTVYDRQKADKKQTKTYFLPANVYNSVNRNSHYGIIRAEVYT